MTWIWTTIFVATFSLSLLPHALPLVSSSIELSMDGNLQMLHFDASMDLRNTAAAFARELELEKAEGGGCKDFECIVDQLHSRMKSQLFEESISQLNSGPVQFLPRYMPERPNSTAHTPPHPRTHLIVVDDFLRNPDELFRFSQLAPFLYKGNHPGMRTASFANTRGFRSIRRAVEGLVGERLPFWFAAFQRSFANDTDNGVHRDHPLYRYSALLFLSPEVPAAYGTSTWRHRHTGLYGSPEEEDARALNRTKESLLDELTDDSSEEAYELVDRIGYKVNRLVVFDSRLNHRSAQLAGYGDYSTGSPGRVILLLFFNTQDPWGQAATVLWHDQDAYKD